MPFFEGILPEELVEQGGTLPVTVSGLEPGQRITATLFSEPIVVSGIPAAVSSALIGVGIVLLLWSFISYLLKFNQMVREAK